MPAGVHPPLRRRLRLLSAVVLATVGVVALFALSRPGSPAPAPALLGPGSIAEHKEGQIAVSQPARPLLGFAINAHHISDLPLYLDSVDSIADLGANALLVVSPMFQERVDSTRIRYRADRCPTDAQLIAILARARSRGLHTTLLPIVLIESPQDKDWRGVIRPRDWNAWWDSYERFIDRFLIIAGAAKVDLLSVGSELNSTEAQLDRWRRIIGRARTRFDGRLTYTANWDRYDQVSFWSRLDTISISAYFELAKDNPDAPVRRLAEAWAQERDKLLRFARRYDRPVLLMELGYPSLPWAAAHPWNYVAGVTAAADHDAQARCYRAFFDAWTGAFAQPNPDGSGALGFHCYLWDPYRGGEPADTGYGVRGKPALDIIRRAFARIRRASAAPDSTAADNSRDASAPDDPRRKEPQRSPQGSETGVGRRFGSAASTTVRRTMFWRIMPGIRSLASPCAMQHGTLSPQGCWRVGLRLVCSACLV